MRAGEVSAISFRKLVQTGTESEYTDAYLIQSEQTPATVMDSETGEQATAFSEGGGAVQTVGAGVIEYSYESDVFEVNTYTTITTPGGVVISQSPTVTGETYVRAETIAALDPETAEEGEYTVQSRHRYKHDGSGASVNFRMASYKTLEQPISAENVFLLGLAASSCGYGCYGWYYTTRYTFFRFGIRQQVESFGRDARYDNVCFRGHEERFPYAYVPLCPKNPFDFCRAQGIGCAADNRAPYIVVYTNIYYIFGFRFCPRSKPVRAFEPEPCRINQ